MNSELVSKKVQDTFSNLNVLSIKEKFLNVYNDIFTDEFRDFLKQGSIKLNENLILNLAILGDLEWCYLEVEKLDDSEIFDLDFPLQLKRYFETHQQVSIKDVDKYIAKQFKKEIIEDITSRTILNLDTNDIKKLNQAMIDFRAKRYFDCANLLAGLVDSQSIKQELFDLKNNRYTDDSFKVAQCWKSFYKVFQNDLSKYFGNKIFSSEEMKEKRHTDLISL